MRLALVLGLAILVSCRPRVDTSSVLDTDTSKLTPDNLGEMLADGPALPGYDGYLKFSVLVQNGQLGAVHYHPRTFEFHGDYLRTLPQFAGMTRQQIDLVALNSAQRKVLLGNLYVKQSLHDDGSWGYKGDAQLLSNDVLDAPTVASVLTHIAPTMPAITGRRYLPYNTQEKYVRDNMALFDQHGVQVVFPEVPDQSLSCYSLGWGVGRVRIMTEEQTVEATKKGTLTPDDILVVDRTPRELPLVAGVISSSVTALSSHVALMSQMTGSPFAYVKEASTLPLLRELADSGEYVFFRLTGQLGGECHYDLVPASEFGTQWLATLQGAKRPKPIALPAPNIQQTRPIDLASSTTVSVSTGGAKAANVQKLMRIVPQNTVKKAVVLPFGFLHQYLNTATLPDGSKVGATVMPLLKALEQTNDMAVVAEKLKQVRDAIKKGKMTATQSKSMLAAVRARWNSGTRIRARSSSNAEDGEYFNGAGLYESKGMCVGDDEHSRSESVCDPQDKRDPVAEGVKGVWASLYTVKAHIARRHYGIPYTRTVSGSPRLMAAMAVLLHESFIGEKANGVAVSTKSKWGDDINTVSTGFPGDELAVTNPEPGKVPEIAVLNQWNNFIQVATSELPPSRTVMTRAQYESLRTLVEKVHKSFMQASPQNKDISLDFEWKVTADDHVILKQVRPVPKGVNPKNPLPRTLVLARKGLRLCPFLRSEDNAVLRKNWMAREFRFATGTFELPETDGEIPQPSMQLVAMEPELGSTTEAFALTGAGSMQSIVRKTEHTDSRYVRMQRTLDDSNPLALSSVSLRFDGSLSSREVALASDFYVELLSAAKVPCQNGGACGSFDDQGNMIDETSRVYFATSAPSCETVQGIPGPEQVETVEKTITGDRNLQITQKITPFHNGACGGIGAGCTHMMLIREYRIRGLLDRELVISGPYNAHFSNTHHGPGEVSVDLYRGQGLTNAERQRLKGMKARFLVYPVFSDSTGDDQDFSMKAAFFSEQFEKTMIGKIEGVR